MRIEHDERSDVCNFFALRVSGPDRVDHLGKALISAQTNRARWGWRRSATPCYECCSRSPAIDGVTLSREGYLYG